MTASLRNALFAGVLASCFCTVLATAEDDTESVDGQASVLEAIENTSIIWPKQPIANDKKGIEIKTALEKEGFAYLPNLGAVILAAKPSDVPQRLAKLFASLPQDNKFPEYSIQANAIVQGFSAECDDYQNFPATEDAVPPRGVRRVGGPVTITDPNSRVWIIDSGIANDFDVAELNVKRGPARVCLPASCPATGACVPPVCVGGQADDDKIGHGTAIAGIIGAIDDTDGLVGVAQGAQLVPVQIFTRRRPVTDLGVVAVALDYVAGAASPGDVVNISWGFESRRWDAVDYGLETALINMANSGLKIAVAAGNIETMGGSGYVQTVFPARLGEHPSGSGGAIVTASAVRITGSPGAWQDRFWRESAFGNGEIHSSNKYYEGPPNFAEPGVNIRTLWPGNMTASCTGTSFAAAHLSGILMKGFPIPDTSTGAPARAADDPSARHPVLGHDPKREDPIGIAP